MTDIFLNTFSTTFVAVLKILLIVLAAGLLVRKKIVTDDQVKGLSAVTIKIFLPCLIFSNILTNFEFRSISWWYLMPVSAALLIGLGVIGGVLIFFGRVKQSKDLIGLASIQNASYIILPIGKVLFADRFDDFTLYTFLFLPGASLVMWSLGKYLLCSGPKEKISFGKMINPPFVACALALALVFIRGGTFEFSLVLDSVGLLGSAAVPVATFILGAMLGSMDLRIKSNIADCMSVVAVKLVAVPACVVAMLYFSSLRESLPLLATFFVLQAAAPPAASLLMIVKHYGGNEQKVESATLISYICCVVTIPFWLAVWEALPGAG